MDALTTLRTEINRLDFTPNEQDSLRKYFTENVEKINVVVSFLPDYATDNEKRGYLKSLIPTPGMLHSRSHRVIFANNTEYLHILVFSFLLLIVKPAQKTHSCYRRATWCHW